MYLGLTDRRQKHPDPHRQVEQVGQLRANRDLAPSQVGRFQDGAPNGVYRCRDHHQSAEQAASILEMRTDQAAAFLRNTPDDVVGISNRLDPEFGAGQDVPTDISKGDRLDGRRDRDSQHLAALGVDGQGPKPAAGSCGSLARLFNLLLHHPGIDQGPYETRHGPGLEPQPDSDLLSCHRPGKQHFPEARPTAGIFRIPTALFSVRQLHGLPAEQTSSSSFSQPRNASTSGRLRACVAVSSQ